MPASPQSEDVARGSFFRNRSKIWLNKGIILPARRREPITKFVVAELPTNASPAPLSSARRCPNGAALRAPRIGASRPPPHNQNRRPAQSQRPGPPPHIPLPQIPLLQIPPLRPCRGRRHGGQVFGDMMD